MYYTFFIKANRKVKWSGRVRGTNANQLVKVSDRCFCNVRSVVSVFGSFTGTSQD